MQKQKNIENGQYLGKFHQIRNQIDQQIRNKWQQQQNLIRKLIVQKNDFDWDIQTLTYIAGVDLSASKQNPDFACVSLVIYNMKKKTSQFSDNRIIKINQPYVPGYLAFRQVPPFYKMLVDLKQKTPQLYPQLILLDGNGILHSNYCGFASHLGVLLNLPTIGIGKTLFYIDGLTKDKVKEQCEKDINKAGDYSLLRGDSGKVWGAAIRNTENAKNPIFVSIGTKIQLELAIDIVKKLSIYRVVEPIRLADKKSRQIIEKADIKKLQSGQQTYEKFDMIYLKDKLKQLKQPK